MGTRRTSGQDRDTKLTDGDTGQVNRTRVPQLRWGRSAVVKQCIMHINRHRDFPAVHVYVL